MSNHAETLRTEITDIRTTYLSGREKVFEALKRCYALLWKVKGDPSYLTPLRKMYKARGLTETSQTDAFTKVVRLVIVEHSKKAYPYAKVFRVAYEEKVSPEDFLDWVEKRGGIEAVRLARKPIPDDEKKTASRDWSDIEADALQYVSQLQPKTSVTFADGKGISFKGNVAMLVVRRSVDTEEEHTGPLSVVEVLGADNSRVKSVLQHYSEQKPLVKSV